MTKAAVITIALTMVLPLFALDEDFPGEELSLQASEDAVDPLAMAPQFKPIVCPPVPPVLGPLKKSNSPSLQASANQIIHAWSSFLAAKNPIHQAKSEAINFAITSASTFEEAHATAKLLLTLGLPQAQEASIKAAELAKKDGDNLEARKALELLCKVEAASK